MMVVIIAHWFEDGQQVFITQLRLQVFILFYKFSENRLYEESILFIVLNDS